MAYSIGFQCTACTACVSICPNNAILRAGRRYRIEPALCTECVLYADEPACVAACPQGAVLTHISIPPTALGAPVSYSNPGGNSR